MSRGYDEHRERMEAVARLGRGLARRAGSRCELCQASGTRLAPYAVPPVPAEPDLEKTAFLCETCLEGVAGKGSVDAHHWRCLQESVWSEVPAVQVSAVRKLREIAEDPDVFWARECLESLYLEPDIEDWINS